MAKKGSPEVYSDQSKVGAHNPKVPSSSLGPATLEDKTAGLPKSGNPAVLHFGAAAQLTASVPLKHTSTRQFHL